MNKGPLSLSPPTIEDLAAMPNEPIPSKSLNFLTGNLFTTLIYLIL